MAAKSTRKVRVKKKKVTPDRRRTRRPDLMFGLRMLLWFVLVIAAFGGALYCVFAWNSARKPEPEPTETPTQAFPQERFRHRLSQSIASSHQRSAPQSEHR